MWIIQKAIRLEHVASYGKSRREGGRGHIQFVGRGNQMSYTMAQCEEHFVYKTNNKTKKAIM